jgi:hypothetical protein
MATVAATAFLGARRRERSAIALVTNGTPLTVEMMCEALKRTRRTYDEHPISEGRGVLELLADHLRQLSSEAK